MKREIKIKNKGIILAGIISASFISLVLCGAVQWLAALIAGAGELKFETRGIMLYAGFKYTGSPAVSIFLHLIPYLIMVAAITFSVYDLKRVPAGKFRLFFILFSLVQTGFLLFNLFHGAFSIILKVNPHNGWVSIVEALGLSEAGGIIFIFFVIIFTAGYVNLLLKRILKYINI